MAKLTPDYTYTDAELLALYRQALAKLSFSEEYEEGGIRVRRADIPGITKAIEWLETRINAADGNSTRNYGRLVRV